MRIALDTDIGGDVDDALALVLAATAPEVDLALVTTVGVNAGTRTRIAQRLLALCGRNDVAVVSGRSRGLGPAGPKLGGWLEGMGRGVLSDDELAEPVRDDPDGAARALAGTDAECVVSIGPLTNVAMSLDGSKRWVAMAASIAVGAEFNFNADPLASRTALERAGEATIVPYDVTRRTYFDESDRRRLHAGGPLAQTLARLIDEWVPAFRRFGYPGGWVCNLHDPLALVVLIEPSLVTVERTTVSVVSRGDEIFLAPGDVREIDLVVDADVEGVRSLCLERLLAADR